MTLPRSAFGALPQGGVASGPAKPVSQRPLRQARGWWLVLAGLAFPMAALAQDSNVAATAAPGASGVGPRFPVEQIEQGRAQFHRTCAQCHGRNMVNAGTTVYDLRKFPATDVDRFQNSVANGRGNMPSFKDALSPEQIGVLWAYVGSRGGKEN